MPESHDNPFDWTTGGPLFHGLPVLHREINVAGQTYCVAALKDAADLLDLPEFEERFIKQDIAPYGLELWPSAVMLAGYFAEGDPGNGRSALELGCGLGLVSAVATRCGWRVTATDNDEDALRFARYTASINDVLLNECSILDWNHPPADKRFARIFAADVLYQLIDHTPFLKCIDALLESDGEALIADPNRGVADRFQQVAEDAGFIVEVIATHATMDDGSKVTGRIFVLRR
jgi:2-polyprenyl-3-methyl-5-hydroxy-6-metoxy-1,4-benzoquinol methylase